MLCRLSGKSLKAMGFNEVHVSSVLAGRLPHDTGLQFVCRAYSAGYADYHGDDFSGYHSHLGQAGAGYGNAGAAGDQFYHGGAVYRAFHCRTAYIQPH